ncbi:hypothetical protein CPC08DRAFT_819874 [Agrocybe pediades]|nr:hypothetical protein CPC08DRAFT_819874 [Agrocybe pediades]
MIMQDLGSLLDELKIPADFSRYENLDAPAVVVLDKWRENISNVLEDIRRICLSKDDAISSLETRRHTIVRIAPFLDQHQLTPDENDVIDSEEPWVNDRSREIAREILTSENVSLSDEEVAIHVLKDDIKPIFRTNPHPHLHTSTGRRIAKPAGGAMAMQDYYDSQPWKEHPGIYKVVLWCIHRIKPETYERVWQLVIPPIMTFLDDYQASYKLQGTLLVQDLLRHVPADLLRRTGVDGLLQQSLRNSLAHLDNPDTPSLIEHAVQASLSLTLLTTTLGTGTNGSSKRFEDLSFLLGEGIISGIWLYAEDKPQVVLATFRALPNLLKALDIGGVRFLKALIPQLAHALIPRPLIDRNPAMQTSAMFVLETLLDTCRPRIPPWKETILDAIGRCWVDLIDEGKKAPQVRAKVQQGRREVKVGLQRLCAKLADVCPEILQEDMQRFMQADSLLFQDLFARAREKTKVEDEGAEDS